MKINRLQYIITFLGLTLSVISVFIIDNYFESLNIRSTEKVAYVKRKEVNSVINKIINEEIIEEEIIEEPTTETTTKKAIIKEVIPEVTTEPVIGVGQEIVFDGLTLEELTIKLNKNLYSNLENKGLYFAEYTKKTGLDPYLALAIVLHETGCKWGCSKLVRECNNIGGIKGSPSCNGGSYRSYETLEAGITGYLEMVYNNYYSKGLTTPELMNPKYAVSTAWASAVNNYMNTIRAS